MGDYIIEISRLEKENKKLEEENGRLKQIIGYIIETLKSDIE